MANNNNNNNNPTKNGGASNRNNNTRRGGRGRGGQNNDNSNNYDKNQDKKKTGFQGQLQIGALKGIVITNNNNLRPTQFRELKKAIPMYCAEQDYVGVDEIIRTKEDWDEITIFHVYIFIRVNKSQCEALACTQRFFARFILRFYAIRIQIYIPVLQLTYF